LIKQKVLASEDNIWIVKPAVSSQGKGIYLLSDLNDLPPMMVDNQPQNFVIQKYLSQPLLINNLKFDIRIYVVVTGIDPLRIYIYNDGLVRFATEEY
jgi:glutathione synthase/RimK-type ligase-like ATP-grasp enzyme